jgi:type VI secretion system protein ImpC
VPRDLAKNFETSDLIKWQSFRDTEDSRYVALTLPRVLVRCRTGPTRSRSTASTSARTSTARITPSTCGALGLRAGAAITDAFAQHGWTAAIRGYEGGGKVESLPAHNYTTSEGDRTLKCPTEIAITDRREKELSDLGFISICHCKGTDYATILRRPDTNKPKKYNTSVANANSRISANLPYILATSRFAHYFKAMMRDKIGGFMTRDNVAIVPQQLDRRLRAARRQRAAGGQGEIPAARGTRRRLRHPGKPGCYRRWRSQAALPARGAECVDAAGGRAPAAGGVTVANQERSGTSRP